MDNTLFGSDSHTANDYHALIRLNPTVGLGPNGL